MAIVDFITELFCRVDDAMQDVPHHTQQVLAPSDPPTYACFDKLSTNGASPISAPIFTS